MASSAAGFQHLHELHRRLHEVQEQLARGPKQIKARQARTAEAEALVAAREKEFKETRALADRRNLDLRSKETHLADLQGKLNAASSNREFDIIRGQMDADRAAKAVLEDEILEYLDRIDAKQQEIVAAKQAAADAAAETRKFADEFEQKSQGLREQEATLKKQIAEAESIVPLEIMPQYRRLIEAHGATALAAAEKGVCTECFVSLTQQAQVQINTGKLLFCPSCGRLLYPAER